MAAARAILANAAAEKSLKAEVARASAAREAAERSLKAANAAAERSLKAAAAAAKREAAAAAAAAKRAARATRASPIRTRGSAREAEVLAEAEAAAEGSAAEAVPVAEPNAAADAEAAHAAEAEEGTEAKAPAAMEHSSRGSKIARGRLAKKEVYFGTKERTTGGVRKEGLTRSKFGRIVSKERHDRGKLHYATSGLNRWNEAIVQARAELGITGFCLMNSSARGKELYVRAKSLLGQDPIPMKRAPRRQTLQLTDAAMQGDSLEANAGARPRRAMKEAALAATGEYAAVLAEAARLVEANTQARPRIAMQEAALALDVDSAVGLAEAKAKARPRRAMKEAALAPEVEGAAGLAEDKDGARPRRAMKEKQEANAGLQRWHAALRQARADLGITGGFIPINGSARGKELYIKIKEILGEPPIPTRRTPRKRPMKQVDGRVVEERVLAKGRRARVLVFKGTMARTQGGLKADSLTRSKFGRIVPKRKQEVAKMHYANCSSDSGLRKWNNAIVQARQELGITGFCLMKGSSDKGKALYARAKEIAAGK